MSPRRLILALSLTIAAAWRFPGLARPREEDVIEHEVTPTGPRELTTSRRWPETQLRRQHRVDGVGRPK